MFRNKSSPSTQKGRRGAAFFVSFSQKGAQAEDFGSIGIGAARKIISSCHTAFLMLYSNHQNLPQRKAANTLEKKSCNCKKNGRGHNYIPGRITIDIEGKEISNRELVCRDCAYKKRGNTAACLRYDQKPPSVLSGGECEFYLKDGSGLLGKKEHSCGGCGHCG